MSPSDHDATNGEGGSIDADSIDTGEPIAELAELTVEAPRGFLGRLWRRIDRRKLGGAVMDFGWHGLFAVFAEFISMAMELFKPGPMAKQQADNTGDES